MTDWLTPEEWRAVTLSLRVATVAVAASLPPGIAIAYLLANLLLGLHIYHGAWSLFQSLGWANPRFNQWRRYFAMGFAAIIYIGNCSFPISVMTGLVDLPK